jgi:predicted transcriptional regulator YdeE
MNQRIEQLALQAGAHVSTRNLMSNPPQHIEIMELWDDRIEKFAELIIRDCIDLVDGYTKPRTIGTHYDAVEQIKHHFGIKE